MAIITPFCGLRFSAALRRSLDLLIAPPYDVIDEARRQELEARHPNNAVHLDLPRAGAGDPYAAAAKRLARWRREGVLALDAEPAFYACEQRFATADGETRSRRGFFARLRIEPFDGGVVIPHEKTLDEPRRDRTRLLEATRTHLSAVFFLHPDPGGRVAALLRDVPNDEDRARQDGGGEIRLAAVRDAGIVRGLREGLAAQWALIADGHHRYESALAYRDARRAAGHEDAEHALAYFCSLEDSGLAIHPIHRLIRALPGFDPSRFLDRLRGEFRVDAVGDPAGLRAALAERRGRPGVFGLALRDRAGFFVAEWSAGSGAGRAEMSDVPEPLRTLDVVLLHRLVLEGMLGITQEAQARQTNLDYVKDAREWFERARDEGTDLAVLMNPTRMDQVIAVTRGGYRLPQKSTFFHPKVPTGLVFDALPS